MARLKMSAGSSGFLKGTEEIETRFERDVFWNEALSVGRMDESTWDVQVSGVVLAANGEAVSRALVRIQPALSSSPVIHRITNAAGHFRAHLFDYGIFTVSAVNERQCGSEHFIVDRGISRVVSLTLKLAACGGE